MLQYDQRLVRRQARRERRNQIINNGHGNVEHEENDHAELREDIDCEYEDWKHDPGERSRCISLWWKHIMINVKLKVSSFAEAYRIVAITQVSSALIERVFSHLTKNVNSSSQNQLEKTIESKLILEINKAVSNIDL